MLVQSAIPSARSRATIRAHSSEGDEYDRGDRVEAVEPRQDGSPRYKRRDEEQRRDRSVVAPEIPGEEQS